jgi:hypothetical protein
MQTVTRRGTKTLPPMSPLLSVSSLVTWSLLVSGKNVATRAGGADTGGCRTMPTVVKDCAVQCAAGVEEQGSGQDVWEVLIDDPSNKLYMRIIQICLGRVAPISG